MRQINKYTSSVLRQHLSCWRNTEEPRGHVCLHPKQCERIADLVSEPRMFQSYIDIAPKLEHIIIKLELQELSNEES
jgi:hypothetical protein